VGIGEAREKGKKAVSFQEEESIKRELTLISIPSTRIGGQVSGMGVGLSSETTGKCFSGWGGHRGREKRRDGRGATAVHG